MKFLHIASFCFLFSLSVLYAGSNEAYIFFVSPNGNDASPGTQEAPFLTLQRARNAVRALPSSAFQNDVFVLLRGGTYRMQEPFELTVEDSGRDGHDVVYSAYPGERPVLSGSVQVTGWEYNSIYNCYQAKVNPCKSRQLYVNGNLAQRAQTTPYPVAFLPNPELGGIQYVVTNYNPPAWRDPSSWTNQSDIEAVILTQWKMMRVPIESVDSASGLLIMQEPAWTNSNIYLSTLTNQPGIWSFWQVTRFENALEFLSEPGQWYLDSSGGYVYYIPLPGEDITTAVVELPLLEVLVDGQGSLVGPIHNIRFEGLTFNYATWLGPSTNNGYVSDQSGQLLLGSGHLPNYIGHDPNVVPTPGNIQFSFAHNIVFYGNVFQYLGGVGLQFGLGSQKNTVDSNLFRVISSSAIEVGGPTLIDHHPFLSEQIVKDNLITNNLINTVCTEYSDAAGIFVGFTTRTTVSQNTIVNVPWSAIAIGWGWGLLDKDSFAGLPASHIGQWGNYSSLTTNKECKIINNRIVSFLNVLWDGGAIYSTGRQGPSLSEGLLIKGNVASGKRPSGGGNIFYTDGGSRCIRIVNNVSFNNPIGITDFGPPPTPPAPFNPLPYPSGPSSLNNVPYGSDMGGCRTLGYIEYKNNYFFEAPLPKTIILDNFINNLLSGLPTYSSYGYFSVCPYSNDGISYPTRLSYDDNHFGFSLSDVPSSLINKAGVQQRPSTIPQELWVLP